MINRYYILPLPNNHSSLWDIVVEDETTVRKNNLQTKMVVKLPIGDNEQHPILNGIKEYTHEDILVEMAKAEWTSNI